jgi:hypothetical protein
LARVAAGRRLPWPCRPKSPVPPPPSSVPNARKTQRQSKEAKAITNDIRLWRCLSWRAIHSQNRVRYDKPLGKEFLNVDVPAK